MKWSMLWPWSSLRAKRAPLRRLPTIARLAVETLEDRLAPSTTGPIDPAYEAWRQQTFQVDDVSVADAGALAQNPTFGPLIGLPSVFSNTSYRGTGYSVAVIDTGIDYNNPNLGGGFGPGHRVIAGWDFANNDADPMDDNGHGTHVAGIIGSSSATYSGVAPGVNLIALKVLSATGSGTFGNVESALQWVVANRAAYNIVAVNLSLGSGNYTTNPYTFLSDEFTSLKNGGVFISVAAGNSFYSNSSAVGLGYPAVDPNVVAVGAVYSGDFGAVAWASGARDNTTAADRIASFSQRGPALGIMAPGAIITSTYLHNTYQAMAGTSMASPVVAGASVLIHQAMDSLHLTANENTILALMKSTGANVVDGDDENDNVTNTGLTFKRLNLYAALSSLGTPTNAAPVLQPIANVNLAPGGSTAVMLSATDPNGDAITYAANLVGGTQSQAYQLKQQLGLAYMGSYYTNVFGQNEKWMSSASGTWYGIFPNGQFRRWAGTMTATLQASSLIATLDAGYYADPSLIWNAQPADGSAPTLSLAGSSLTIHAPAGATGSFQIQVTASDGQLSSTRTFTATIQGNSAPQLAAIANRAMVPNHSYAIALSATDAQNDPITYTAAIVGSFATPPATLAVNGNQLTIQTSPNFVGSFDVRVSVSDGSLSASATFRVTVAVDAGSKRLGGDFNGDGRQDSASFNKDGSWTVRLAQADGTFVNQQWDKWSAASNWKFVSVGDFNGDGKTDIVGFNASGRWWVGLSTGSAFTTQPWVQWSAAYAWKTIQLGDFNGDGKTDIVGFNTGGRWWVGLSTGAAFTKESWASWSTASFWTTVQVGDFDGDGKTDVLGFKTSGSVWVGLATRANFATTFWTQWAPAAQWTSLHVADIDGNGLPDFVGHNKDGNWYVAYSTGSGFRSEIWNSATPPV